MSTQPIVDASKGTLIVRPDATRASKLNTFNERFHTAPISIPASKLAGRVQVTERDESPASKHSTPASSISPSVLCNLLGNLHLAPSPLPCPPTATGSREASPKPPTHGAPSPGAPTSIHSTPVAMHRSSWILNYPTPSLVSCPASAAVSREASPKPPAKGSSSPSTPASTHSTPVARSSSISPQAIAASRESPPKGSPSPSATAYGQPTPGTPSSILNYPTPSPVPCPATVAGSREASPNPSAKGSPSPGTPASTHSTPVARSSISPQAIAASRESPPKGSPSPSVTAYGQPTPGALSHSSSVKNPHLAPQLAVIAASKTLPTKTGQDVSPQPSPSGVSSAASAAKATAIAEKPKNCVQGIDLDTLKLISKTENSRVYRAIKVESTPIGSFRREVILKVNQNDPHQTEIANILKLKANGVHRVVDLLDHFNGGLLKHSSFTDRDTVMVLGFAGEDLFQFARTGGYNYKTIVHITKQLLETLQGFAALNMAHGDLTSKNVVIDSKTLTIKVIDLLNCVQPGEIEAPFTSLWWRAPEFFTKLAQFDTSIDGFSLGCILYQLVTGRTLFPSDWNSVKGDPIAQDMLHMNWIVSRLGIPSDSYIEKAAQGGLFFKKEGSKYVFTQKLMDKPGAWKTQLHKSLTDKGATQSEADLFVTFMGRILCYENRMSAAEALALFTK